MPKSLVPQAISDAISYERLKAGHVKGVLPILAKLREDINDVILRIDTDSNKDVNKRLRLINELVDDAFLQIEDLLLREYTDMIPVVVEKEEKAILPLIGEQIPIEDKSIALVVPVILASVVLGKKFKTHLKDSREIVKGRTAAQVRSGLSDNMNVVQIAKGISGTKSNRYKDGSFNKTFNSIDSITRTVVQGFISRTKLWVWDKRGVSKYRWISVLDNRTTAICRGRSNKVYSIGEGPTPPAHYRCRSIIVPYVPGAIVPKSYAEYLRSLERDKVEDILGKKKAELFLSGKIKLDRFTTPAGRELTLEELRNRT